MLLLRHVNVPCRLRICSLFRSLFESLEAFFDVLEDFLSRAFQNRHHVGLVYDVQKIIVLELTDGIVVFDFDLELHLSLSCDVRLLNLVRFAILDRNFFQIVLRGLG